MVAELFHLAAQRNIEKGLPGFRMQQWYFFACTAFFVYGRLLKSNLLVEVSENDWLPGIISAPSPPFVARFRSPRWSHRQAGL
jgi:hypothetical protein